MLKSDDNNVLDKFIMAIFAALLCSLLSALYISKTHIADMSYNELHITATHAGKTSIFEPPS